MESGAANPPTGSEAAANIAAAEARYRSLIQGATYGIFRSSAEGRFLMVNPALVRMLGYPSAEALLGVDIAADVYVDAADRARLTALCDSAGTLEGVEVDWRRLDGQTIRVRLSGRAVRDDGGGVESFEVIAEDVTRRVLLEEQLRQAHKMEAVGRMAGGIAHDFNNILSVISCYSDLLACKLVDDENSFHYADEIRKVSHRGSSLVRHLLAFSRGQTMAPEILDVGTVVAEMDTLLRRLTGEHIDLAILADADLGKVEIDPGLVDQLLMNLVANARDAMPAGGKLTIETRNVLLDEAYTDCHLGARPGHYVMLAVSDSGTGMDAATLARVFEPFFTTKPSGKGTGLGMATVFGIVKHNRGDIRIYSEPDRGTVVRIYLPRTDAPAAPPPTVIDVRRGSETVLVVEDDRSIRRVAQRILSQRGYEVLTAGSGPEAIRLSESHPRQVDLLVADSVLPGPTGPELAARLRKRFPQLKVLHMSGYTGAAARRHGLVDVRTPFIEKPFTPAMLAGKVREVLDAV